MLFNDRIPFDLSLDKDFYGPNLYPTYTDRVSEYLERLSEQENEYPHITSLIQESPVISFMWFRYASRIGWPFFYAIAKVEEGVDVVFKQMCLDPQKEAVESLQLLQGDIITEADEQTIADFLRAPKLVKVVNRADSVQVWQLDFLLKVGFLQEDILLEFLVSSISREFCLIFEERIKGHIRAITIDQARDLVSVTDLDELCKRIGL